MPESGRCQGCEDAPVGMVVEHDAGCLIVEADYACCALKDGHEGCCAYRCSTCDGAGRLGCYPDDLGCECGMCDGTGYCPECGGNGWFNEFGDQCMAPAKDELP